MNSQPQLRVIDDERDRLASWVKALKAVPELAAWSVEGMETDPLIQAIEVLEQRRLDSRNHPLLRTFEPACDFDSVDILVIDYELASLTPSGSITGESIAYLARAYSRAGYIVVLNEMDENQFDLTLAGNLDSYSDLVLGSRQLGNQGLWAEPFQGFRPWSWPVIPRELKRLQKLSAGLVAHLDNPVLAALALDRVPLPRATRAFLEGDLLAEETSFLEFVQSGAGGLRRNDCPLNREAAARVAVSRLGRWLETRILSAQDLLVDAPHLVPRVPSLLIGDPATADSWNAVATLASPAAALAVDRVASSAYAQSQWLSRPAWHWPAIAKDGSLPEVSSPWTALEPNVAFCEDVSAFLPLDAVKEFVADVSGPFARRFVLNRDSEAANRFPDVRDVSYRPAVRFALNR